jgi:parallel beta helix pectate lyase-like protein
LFWNIFLVIIRKSIEINLSFTDKTLCMKTFLKKRDIVFIIILSASIIPLLSGTQSVQMVSAAETEWNFDGYIDGVYYKNTSFAFDNEITIESGGSLRLSNLTLTVDGSFKIEVSNGGTLIIENCTIKSSNIGNYGLVINAFYGSNLTIIDSDISCIKNVFSDTIYGDGRSFWIETSNARIVNNKFTNGVSDNFYLCLYNNTGTNVTITDNNFIGKFEEPGLVSIVIRDSPSGTFYSIENNTFQDVNAIHLEYAENIIIKNNTLSRLQYSNENYPGIYSRACDNITFTGNSIENYYRCIQVESSNNMKIQYNFMNSPGLNIFLSENDQMDISYNTFNRTTVEDDTNIVQLSGTNYNVTGNQFNLKSVNGAPHNPFSFPYSLANKNITLNITNPNKVNGKNIIKYENIKDTTLDYTGQSLGQVYFYNVSSSTIKSLTISDAGGIYLIGDYDNITFDDIHISKSTGHGLYCENGITDSKIINSEFNYCAGSGISLASSEIIIQNTTTNNNFIGMEFLRHVFDSTISNCRINNNGYLLGIPNDDQEANPFMIYGGGMVFHYGNNVTIENCNFTNNWYIGLGLLQKIESQHLTNFTIKTNNFAQYIDAKSQKYSVSAFDNSTGTNKWEDNRYSENPEINKPYKIPGNTSVSDVSQSFIDIDQDGASSIAELAWGSSDDNSDSDTDGIGDHDEIFKYKTSPISIDTDEDLLTDYQEIFTTFTNPLMYDSDSDGFSDYYEFIYGTNGTDSSDFPGNNVVHEKEGTSQYSEAEDLRGGIPGFPLGYFLPILFITVMLIIRKQRKKLKNGGKF